MEPRTSVVNIWYRASDQSYRIDVPSAKVYGVVARIGGSVAEDAQRWPRLSLLALQVVVRIDGVAEDGIYKPSDVSACFVSNDNQTLAPRYAGSEYLHGRVVDVLTAESDSRSCGWAISKSNLSFTLWVDRATGFALKLEGATSDGNLVYRDEITSFQTGVALDPSLFVVTALATSTPPTDATVSPTVAGYNPTPPLNPSLEKVGWVGNVSSLVFTYTSYNYFTDTNQTVIYYQAPYRWRVENNGVVSYQQNERSIDQGSLLLASLSLDNYFAWPRECYNSVQIVGNDTVAGRRVRVERAVANSNPCNVQGGRAYYTDTVWIDLETGIALKREGLAEEGSIVHPHEVTATGIQVNVPLDPSLFFEDAAIPPTDATVSPTVAGYNPTPPLNPSLEKVGWVGNVSSLVFTYTSYNYFTDTDKTVIYYQAPYRWRVENNGVVSYQQNERSINQEPLTLSSLDLSFDFALPGDCYNPAQTVGNDTVAGRRVRVVRAVANINPCNFQGRTYYTDTVWIDLETGIALKREGLDGKGTIVHSQEVTGIQVNVPLDPSLFNTR